MAFYLVKYRDNSFLLSCLLLWNAYETSVGKFYEERSLGRPRRRWEDNIKMYLNELEYEGVDWIFLTQDRDQW
jgi:hypothetical protein